MGEVLLEKLDENNYRINLQKVSYDSPHFPISIYADERNIEKHFIVWRENKGDICSLPVGVADSKEELPKKTYKHARDLAEKFARNLGFKLIEMTDIPKKERSLEKVTMDYSLGQGS
ncbi:MAG: hypothetical protein ABIH28_04005 [archaeon]